MTNLFDKLKEKFALDGYVDVFGKDLTDFLRSELLATARGMKVSDEMPYDPNVPPDVLQEMYRDMENFKKGWNQALSDFLKALGISEEI